MSYLFTESETAAFKHLIAIAIENPDIELEVRFERSPCGSQEQLKFKPGVSLRTFTHLRTILPQDPAHHPIDKQVELITIYPNNVRKIEKRGDMNETIVEWQHKESIDKKIDVDYGFRIALSRETNVPPMNDDIQPDLLRLRTRYSYLVKDYFKRPEWRYDLTVTESVRYNDVEMVDKLKSKFKKRQSQSNFQNEVYEVELEYIGNKTKTHQIQRTPLGIYKFACVAIEYILKHNDLDMGRSKLITKKQARKIMDQYLGLVNVKRHNVELDCYDYELLLQYYRKQIFEKKELYELRKEYETFETIMYELRRVLEPKDLTVGYMSDYFVGPQPVGLTRHTLHNIGSVKRYCVQRKFDGQRNLLFIDISGWCYFIDRTMYIKKAALPRLSNLSQTLIDGEFIRESNGPYTYIPFDLLILHQNDLRNIKKEHYRERYKKLTFIVKEMQSKSNPQQHIVIKLDEFINPYANELHRTLDKSLKYMKQFPDSSDGVIFQPLSDPYPLNEKTWHSRYKWKPAHKNTIDLQCRHEGGRQWSLFAKVQVVPIQYENQIVDAVIYQSSQKETKLYIIDKQALATVSTNEYKKMRSYAKKSNTKKRSYTDFVCFELEGKPLGRIELSDETIRKLGIKHMSIVECSYDKETDKLVPLQVRYTYIICINVCWFVYLFILDGIKQKRDKQIFIQPH